MHLRIRRFLPLLALAAGVAATVLARGSSPALLPGAGSWFGDNWQYGALLVAWSATVALSPDLCREVRQPWLLVAGVAVTWVSSAVGHVTFPLGGYDTHAKMRLYTYSFLAGLAFVIAARRASIEKPGSDWPARLAAYLTVTFIVLGGMFVSGREGVLSRGPGLPAVGALEHRLLYERPHFFGPYDVAVEPDTGPPGQAKPAVVFLLSTTDGEGVVVDLESVTAHQFSLSEALEASLLTGDDSAGEVTSARLSDLTVRWGPAPVGVGGATSIRVDGRADLRFAQGLSLDCVEFVVDIGLPGSSAPGSVAVQSAELGMYEQGGKPTAPDLEGVRVADDRVLGPSADGLRLTNGRHPLAA